MGEGCGVVGDPSGQKPMASSRRRARQPRVSGGRPHKHTVRLSDKEQEQIEARAIVAGVSVPRLMVESALAGDAETASERRALVAEFLAVRRLLSAVSNNVNQLAKVANSTGETPPELSATLHATARVIKRLDNATARLAPNHRGARQAGGDDE
jgi:uncharacterized protein (DUF1778 family)